MKFTEVIGQDETIAHLIQLKDEGRIPHAILLCGPEGCGKMAVAMSFASYLLCEDKTSGEDSCDGCLSCRMIKKWAHPDLYFSYPVIRPAGTNPEHKMTSDDFSSEWREMLLSEGAYFSMNTWLKAMHAENQQAEIGVGESEIIIHNVNIKPSRGGYKIYIVWLPERMNTQCANKLLKEIEEPPAGTIYIMVCERPELLLETIRSRTQRINMKQISDDMMEKALIERRGIDAETARRLARISSGNWLKATEMLDAGNENRLFLDMFIMLMRLSYMRNIKDLKKWSETAAGYGREKQKRMLTYFLKMIRESFMYNFRNPELCYMTSEEEAFAKNFARFINENNVIEISELLSTSLNDIAQNANGKIVFFDMALKMIVLLIQ